MDKQLQQFKKQLENGQLAQSFLIVGPEKTGKFSAVIKMAGILNDLNDEQLIAIKKGELADIILIESEASKQAVRTVGNFSSGPTTGSSAVEPLEKPSKKQQKSKKDTITKKQIDGVMKSINLKNFQFKKKIVIIKEANKMTNTAANSLLKLIEEPSNNLVIFLLVNNENDVLTTIKSRCQAVRFSFASDKQIEENIQKEYSIGRKKMQEIVGLSGGRIELAKQYAKDPKRMKLAQKVRDDFRKALRGGKLEQIKLVDGLIKDSDDLLWIINEWIWYLKLFLEKNIQEKQPVAVVKKIHSILDNLLKTRDIIKTTNVNKKYS